MLCISLLVLLGAVVAGCAPAVDTCDQFAPAAGKLPKDCQPKPVTSQPYKQAKYCYSSLGQTDCYAEPQPGRAGYLGAGD
ncbi:MAG TPA: hypothetical protein VGV37_00360 [Aliidongia sp.]|uniref:hypothetical protein n=1 Tax=Aliidongia sp. TaxID=1914230 RepID=UPI002DDCA8F4|nr:hypothetical protein [Aliidongia sp.]HEV2672959.1 hypothetical protein [Aliidongia sp.]